MESPIYAKDMRIKLCVDSWGHWETKHGDRWSAKGGTHVHLLGTSMCIPSKALMPAQVLRTTAYPNRHQRIAWNRKYFQVKLSTDFRFDVSLALLWWPAVGQTPVGCDWHLYQKPLCKADYLPLHPHHVQAKHWPRGLSRQVLSCDWEEAWLQDVVASAGRKWLSSAQSPGPLCAGDTTPVYISQVGQERLAATLLSRH